MRDARHRFSACVIEKVALKKHIARFAHTNVAIKETRPWIASTERSSLPTMSAGGVEKAEQLVEEAV